MTDGAGDGLVTLAIDGKEVTVPQGTLIIRAAEQLGIEIPRFCDHPLLEPVAACRQCYVKVIVRSNCVVISFHEEGDQIDEDN